MLRPLPPAVTRPLSVLVLVTWVVSMAVLVQRSYFQDSTTLAADLARYGPAAQWRGVYYKGEKIGFTVSQIAPTADGFELQEDGRLQMSLLGAVTPARLRTTARVDRGFALQSFEFSLDPGSGPIAVSGRVVGQALEIAVRTSAGSSTERRQLAEPPQLPLNLARRLANGGLVSGATHRLTLFDPATLRNAPVTLRVGPRESTRTGQGRVPAFRVEMAFGPLRTTSWITDTGEVVREESPTGLLAVRESAELAQRLAVSNRMQMDLLESSAVQPVTSRRIDEPRDVRVLRLRLEGADLSSPDVRGAGQTVAGDVVEIVDARRLRAGPPDPDVARYLAPEPLIESDAPEIRAEAQRAAGTALGARARAERLTRHVSALLEKKPTVSLPSAREVLRTRVGDCNEHTALFVAMARAIGIPSRIAVGLAFSRGAFYYDAWPEVYIDEGGGRGLWLPVDPTFSQFPADAMHLRLARGGLDRQASIVPLIGRLKISILDVELEPGSTPTLVGRAPDDFRPLSIPMPQRRAGGCWSVPADPGPLQPVRR